LASRHRQRSGMEPVQGGPVQRPGHAPTRTTSQSHFIKTTHFYTCCRKLPTPGLLPSPAQRGRPHPVVAAH
jgi:hypothetical protein